MLRKHIIGILAILVGASALVCAVLWEGEYEEREKQQREQKLRNKVEIDLKIFKVTFGKDKEAKKNREVVSETKYPPLYISTIALAVLALVLAPLAWIKEKEPIISGVAVAFGGIALFFHWVAIGIGIGVTLIVILLILSSIG
ncbi:MAG: hypothetical protein OEM02_01165 [Desulfobulbaceae bacterium]|nr:hypothetical protein [Desulfobulbaceae bacterium]